MQLSPVRYYDSNKFSNTTTLVYMNMQQYFCNQIFRGDGTRCFYATEEYAFRRRLDLLSKNGSSSVNELQLPFMCYSRNYNWRVDQTRVGIQNATSALVGIPDPTYGNVNMRFMQVEQMLNCVAFFSSESDAQIAYETLMWIQKPSAQQGVIEGLSYKGYSIPIPVYLGIEQLDYNPTYKESQWLEANRIIPINFTVKLKSVIMDQIPQDNNGNTFWVDQQPVITNHVILDFLSYVYDQNWNSSHALWEVDRIIGSSINVNGNITASNMTDNSVQLNWTYNTGVSQSLQETVTLLVNNGLYSATAMLSAGTYTFQGLSPGTVYNFSIWMLGTDSSTYKYTVDATTTSHAYVPTITAVPSY